MGKVTFTLTSDDREHIENNIMPFMKEFAKESDRAAVILGAAKLDSLLRLMLARIMLESPDKDQDTLLDNDSPLGSFGAKITLAYRLGLIDLTLLHALRSAKRIRNDFAHEVEANNLDVSPHRDRVASMVEPLKNEYPYKVGLSGYDPREKKTQARKQFQAALAMIVVFLEFMLVKYKLAPHKWPKARLVLPKE